MNITGKEYQIKHILKNFNFDHVKSCMDCLDWKWYMGENEFDEDWETNRVPTTSQIILSALEMLSMCYDQFRDLAMEEKQEYHISGGGFCATVNEEGYLNLQIVLDEYGSIAEAKNDIWVERIDKQNDMDSRITIA